MIPCHFRRLAVVGVLTLAAALSLGDVSAAGASIIVDQVSVDGRIGSWVLTKPDGTTVNGSVLSQFLGSGITAGNYTLEVTPPDGKVASIHVVEDGQVVRHRTGTMVDFTTAGTNPVMINVAYGPFGDVTIDSDPRGAPFELISSRFPRLTGRTPLILDDMPLVQYRAQFGELAGCLQPRHQDRVLLQRSRLDFYGGYTCEGALTTREVGAPEVNLVFEKQLRVSQLTNQKEVLAGSPITITVGVRNLDRKTLNDLTLSVRYDPDLVDPPFIIPKGGQLNGDLITWNIPVLYATQSWTVDLPVTLHEDLTAGSYIITTARVSGADVHESVMAHDIVSRAEISVMTMLPQTGVRFDILFVALAALCALMLTFQTRRKLSVVRKV